MYAQEVIVNDSNTIDLEGTIIPGSGGDNGTSGGSGESDPGAGSGGGASNSSSPAIETITVTSNSGTGGTGSNGSNSGTGNSGTGQNPSSVSGTGSTSSTGGTSGGSATASDIVSTLIGNQAASMSGGGGGGAGTISVHASVARAALAARGIGAFLIPGFNTGSSFGRSLTLRTNEDFVVVAASTALTDGRIEDIALAAGTLHISYRARGALLAFIPVTYRIMIVATPDPTPGTVTVKFPWYKFLLRAYVSKKNIENDVHSSFGSIRTDGGMIDARSRLLAEISRRLSERFDTVEGSVAAR